MAFDLSDFFLTGLEHIAEGTIAEQINRRIIPELIDMKFGPQDEYPKLMPSGISDKAGKELAEVMEILARGQIIKPDDKLEENARKRFSLPEADKTTSRDTKSPESVMNKTVLSEGQFEVQLAEKTVRGDIKKGAESLEMIMKKNLVAIGDAYRKQIVASFEKLPPSQRLNAIKNLTPRGVTSYGNELQGELASIARDALKRVRKEVPGGDKIELAEKMTDLPPMVSKKIKAQSELLTKAQLADLEKVLFFHYTNSVEDISDPRLLDSELEEITKDYVEGPSVRVGAANTASVITNTARNVFLFSDEAMEKIESFTFRNPSPVSQICQNLNGRTFLANDPGVQSYLPPLHHNCKSYIEPNLKGQRNPNVSGAGLRPTGSEDQIAKMEKEISLSEIAMILGHDCEDC